jgi:gamma-glutamyltranspeptidase / glutathione hydrolase
VTVVYESGTSVYHLGRASSAVPGDVAGLAQLLAEAGTLPLDVVLEPAIRLAHDGYVLNKYQAYLIRLVDVIFNYDPACRRVYAPRGRWLEPGERLANPALGRTLEQIATDGPATFYTGALADAILADHRANGGLLTAEDLAAYRVIKRAPLRFDYRGRDVLTNPPPSAGGILIACALRLFGRADLAGLAHGDLDHVALLAEVQRQTTIARYRDRPVALPDAASWAAWLDDAARRADWTAIQAALAADSVRHGPDNPRGHASTTHISAIDETGLAVGLTTTPGETAGYFVDETGVLMNNMLGEEIGRASCRERV